jgi:hypothetical protein
LKIGDWDPDDFVALGFEFETDEPGNPGSVILIVAEERGPRLPAVIVAGDTFGPYPFKSVK